MSGPGADSKGAGPGGKRRYVAPALSSGEALERVAFAACPITAFDDQGEMTCKDGPNDPEYPPAS
jgi:hypothetical protein